MVIAVRFHLFPFRTEKLSSLTPMVLRFARGRVGSRLFKVRSKGLTFFCVLTYRKGRVPAFLPRHDPNVFGGFYLQKRRCALPPMTDNMNCGMIRRVLCRLGSLCLYSAFADGGGTIRQLGKKRKMPDPISGRACGNYFVEVVSFGRKSMS